MDDALQMSTGDTWPSVKIGLSEYVFKTENTCIGCDTMMLQRTECDCKLHGAVTAGGKQQGEKTPMLATAPVY